MKNWQCVWCCIEDRESGKQKDWQLAAHTVLQRKRCSILNLYKEFTFFFEKFSASRFDCNFFIFFNISDSPKSWFLLHWASLCTTISGVVMLLLARGHYSIDVLIAYWITTRIWWLYHTMANNITLKGDTDNPFNYLNRIWWWYIFRYFEKNVPCNLPRRFGWPIPRKLRRWKPTSFFFRRRSLRSVTSPTASTAAVTPTAPSTTVDVERTLPWCL